MSDSINTNSPLGEDFYSFLKEDEEINYETNSELKVANKKNNKRKNKKIDVDDSVNYFENTGSVPDNKRNGIDIDELSTSFY